MWSIGGEWECRPVFTRHILHRCYEAKEHEERIHVSRMRASKDKKLDSVPIRESRPRRTHCRSYCGSLAPSLVPLQRAALVLEPLDRASASSIEIDIH